MRTKSLLLAAAALAAGALSSQAQTVYSANIVGYVNTPLNVGYSALNIPLDFTGGNTLTNLLPNPINPSTLAGPYDGTTVYTWNGSGYTIFTLDSSQPTGVGDAQDINAVPSPTINPGELIYFNNNSGVNQTNTFVGTVHTDGAATGTNSIGTTTNALPLGYSFVSSKLPIGGGVSTVLQLTNTIVAGAGILDGATIYLPNINPTTGAFLGYQIVTFDSSQPTGFGDAQDINPVAEPVIPVGTGFIFNNNTGKALTWNQSY
jgi:opacity protein-like surface antigen